MKDKNFGLLGLLLVAIIWGSGFVASDLLLLSLSPLALLACRFTIAAIVLIIINFRKLMFLNKENAIAGTILGVILYISFSFQTFGLKYSSPSHNAFLTSVNVIIVPFIVWGITKIRVDIYGFLGAFLSITGIGILSLTHNFTLSYGDILNLTCAFGFAFHVFFSGKFAKKYDTVTFVTIQMIVAALLSILFLIISGDTSIKLLDSKSIIGVLYIGIIVTAFAFFLQSKCQEKLGDTTSAIIMSMESVFGAIFSVLIINENYTPRMLVGCIFILSGVIFSQTKPFSLSKKGIKIQTEF
ncbi:MAG: DMT family transporter [Spirochaetaceae bacterium]|nr:DMT family transporter [Spirochaetaceae bacterium]